MTAKKTTTSKKPAAPAQAAPAAAPVKRKPKAKPQAPAKKPATARKQAAAAAPKEKPKPLKNVRKLQHVEPATPGDTKPEALDAEEVAVKAGRPSLYKPEFVAMAKTMCALMGATDKELGAVLGVTERTINKWKLKHPDFKEALTNGKIVADAQVAAALYKTAIGYEHDDIDIRTVALGMNAGSEIVITPIKKIVQPNPQSITWWLKNRRPADWKDKSEVSVETVNLDHEAATERFGKNMEAARIKQEAVRARRKAMGLTGD